MGTTPVPRGDRGHGPKNILLTGLWTEVCVTWPTIEMIAAGYNIYIVEDCCGATSQAAHEAALSRMVQAGAIRLTTIPALLEWQRDWAKKEHYDNLMGLIKGQGGAYGIGRRVRLHDGASRAAIRAETAGRPGGQETLRRAHENLAWSSLPVSRFAPCSRSAPPRKRPARPRKHRSAPSLSASPFR
ncbi:MAG: isochorismatase family protein [Chthoniobacter sp.]